MQLPDSYVDVAGRPIARFQPAALLTSEQDGEGAITRPHLQDVKQVAAGC